jgi:hypothetical protein
MKVRELQNRRQLTLTDKPQQVKAPIVFEQVHSHRLLPTSSTPFLANTPFSTAYHLAPSTRKPSRLSSGPLNFNDPNS